MPRVLRARGDESDDLCPSHAVLALDGQGCEGRPLPLPRPPALLRDGLRAASRSVDDVAAIMGISAAMAHVYAHENTETLQREAIQAGTNPAILALA